MPRKTTTPKKKEPDAPKVIAYRVDADAFTQAIGVLAGLPYNQVGNLINTLRGAKEIHEEEKA